MSTKALGTFPNESENLTSAPKLIEVKTACNQDSDKKIQCSTPDIEPIRTDPHERPSHTDAMER